MAGLTEREILLTRILISADEFRKSDEAGQSVVALAAVQTFGEYLDRYLERHAQCWNN